MSPAPSSLPPDAIAPGDDAEAPAAVEPCQVSDVRVSPSATAPAARTAPLVLSFTGSAPRRKLVVGGPDGELEGALVESERGMLFAPSRPYPAGVEISWRASLCGEVHEGSFVTGALHRGLDGDALRDVYAGRAWALDLRTTRWSEPRPSPSSRLPWALGGALLVEVAPVSSTEAHLRLAAALTDASGVFAQAPGAVEEIAVSLGEGGAYLRFALQRLALATRGGRVVLHDVDVTLGLSDEGPADGRVVAEMDVRDWSSDGGRDGCTVLAEEAGVECVPCTSDGVLACAALDLGDVRGMPSDLRVQKAE